MLLNEIIDFPSELFCYFILLGQLFEYFQVFMFLLVLQSNVGYQSPHTIDVVSQNYATDCFNENHEAGFLIASRDDITESDSEHNGGTPIVGPNILFIPSCILNPPFNHPVFGLI